MPAGSGRRRLTGFGLTIDSDRPIAGSCADVRGAAQGADLVIDTMPPQRPDPDERALYRWDGDTLTFAPPGVGRFHCRPDRIVIVAEHDAEDDMVSGLLIATALPAVLWMRRDAVLHAAAVVSPDGFALALAGVSGIGKSTVTRQLLAAGAGLLADDTIRLSGSGGRVDASGLPGGYHFAPPDGPTRLFHPIAAPQRVPCAALGAVAILSRCDAGAQMVHVTGTKALARLIDNQHRPAIPAVLGCRGDALAHLARLAEQCAVYEWRRSARTIDDAERAMLAEIGFVLQEPR